MNMILLRKHSNIFKTLQASLPWNDTAQFSTIRTEIYDQLASTALTLFFLCGRLFIHVHVNNL